MGLSHLSAVCRRHLIGIRWVRVGTCGRTSLGGTSSLHFKTKEREMNRGDWIGEEADGDGVADSLTMVVSRGRSRARVNQ
jgi:hypothetical protein